MNAIEIVSGFEFSDNISARMYDNDLCRNVILAIARFGAVKFNADDGEEAREAVDLLKENNDYWELLNVEGDEHNYYLVRDNIVKVTEDGIE